MTNSENTEEGLYVSGLDVSVRVSGLMTGPNAGVVPWWCLCLALSLVESLVGVRSLSLPLFHATRRLVELKVVVVVSVVDE